ncbi:hypothetical protein [Undibacterium pigrum]|nr:hypothetical protein [Undibacterium pigrum]
MVIPVTGSGSHLVHVHQVDRDSGTGGEAEKSSNGRLQWLEL